MKFLLVIIACHVFLGHISQISHTAINDITCCLAAKLDEINENYCHQTIQASTRSLFSMTHIDKLTRHRKNLFLLCPYFFTHGPESLGIEQEYLNTRYFGNGSWKRIFEFVLISYIRLMIFSTDTF